MPKKGFSRNSEKFQIVEILQKGNKLIFPIPKHQKIENSGGKHLVRYYIQSTQKLRLGAQNKFADITGQQILVNFSVG